MQRRAPGRPTRQAVGPAEPTSALQTVRTLAGKLQRLREGAKAEASLREFVRLAWPAIEPSHPFVPGRHIDAICEHLEAVSKGQIRDLLINLPPRCSKSSVVDVCWPAWEWIKNPWMQWIFLSHSYDLTVRDSLRMRRLIEGQWYRGQWGSRFSLVSDQNTLDNYATDANGFRYSLTPGRVTGEGGDRLVYDDPHKATEADTDSIRNGIIEDFDQAISSRYRDPKTFCRIVCMQRLHERDLAAHVKEQGFVVLDIPMEWDGRDNASVIGWKDWRTEPGELMWPERMGAAEVAREKEKLGRRAYAAQHQQRPAPASGGLFRRNYWRFWTTAEHSETPIETINDKGEKSLAPPFQLPERFDQIVQSWDMTFKDTDGSDFVAAHAWGRHGANFYLLGRMHRKMDYVSTLKAVREFTKDFACPAKLVEDKANGPAVISSLKNEIPGLIAVSPEGGKIARANAVVPYFEAQNVFLPTPHSFAWVKDFIEDCANFPAAAHDDDVDAMTQAIRYLAECMAHSAFPEFRSSPRIGEDARHIHVVASKDDSAVEPSWRRFVSVGITRESAAALWFCHKPNGTIRVYRELDLTGSDATEIGRLIAHASLSDVLELQTVPNLPETRYSIWLEKTCFKAIDSAGSVAQLIQRGVASFVPEETRWDFRNEVARAFRAARINCETPIESENASRQRFRGLLAVNDDAPPAWDRNTAVELSKEDFQKYRAYINAVDGVGIQDTPRIKFSDCPQTCGAIAGARSDEDIENPWLKALMIGVSVPVARKKETQIKLVSPLQRRPNVPPRFRRAANF